MRSGACWVPSNACRVRVRLHVGRSRMRVGSSSFRTFLLVHRSTKDSCCHIRLSIRSMVPFAILPVGVLVPYCPRALLRSPPCSHWPRKVPGCAFCVAPGLCRCWQIALRPPLCASFCPRRVPSGAQPRMASTSLTHCKASCRGSAAGHLGTTRTARAKEVVFSLLFECVSRVPLLFVQCIQLWHSYSQTWVCVKKRVQSETEKSCFKGVLLWRFCGASSEERS